jgi:hypothetical protein
MTIEFFPVKIEAYDMDIKEAIFKVEAMDENCCTVEVTTSLCNSNVVEVTEAIREAVKMLKLEGS